MGTLVLLLALAAGPSEAATIKETVDLVEVNHFFDERGKRVFDQAIFYDWCPLEGRYQVRAWRLLKSKGQFPARDWKRGGYAAIWNDGDVLRWIRAPVLRETFTQYDPELCEREVLPKERRHELRKLRFVHPLRALDARLLRPATMGPIP